MTAEEAKKVAVASYEPEYPVEARRRHLTGSGVLELKLSPDTGEVLSVTVITSTGHSILDRAAIDAFKRWRFRPHMFSRVKVPITFSIPKKSGQPAKQITAPVTSGSAQDTDIASVPSKNHSIYAPRPDYPLEARRQHLTGSAILILHIDKPSGTVTSIDVAKSTGHKILDDAATGAFLRWRFKPGLYTKIKVPIRYTMD
jgi:TonB family protein